MLSTSVKADSQDVFVCKGDADSKIASAALDLAKENQAVAVADDTCCSYVVTSLEGRSQRYIFMGGNKCWSIKDIQCAFGDIKEHLLFIHAWSGCDSA